MVWMRLMQSLQSFDLITKSGLLPLHYSLKSLLYLDAICFIKVISKRNQKFAR